MFGLSNRPPVDSRLLQGSNNRRQGNLPPWYYDAVLDDKIVAVQPARSIAVLSWCDTRSLVGYQSASSSSNGSA